MPETLVAIGSAVTAGTATGATAAVVGGTAVSTALGAVGANVQYQAGQRAAEAQQAAQATQRRRQNIQALREAQIRRATLQQQSANTGTLNSSGYSGGTSSLQSQLGSNIGFANTLEGFGRQQLAAQQTADRARGVTGLVQSGADAFSRMPPIQQSLVDANAMAATSAYDGLGMSTGRPRV